MTDGERTNPETKTPKRKTAKRKTAKAASGTKKTTAKSAAARTASAADTQEGLSLFRRLDAWARVFVQRPDVVVEAHERGKPWKAASNSIYASGDVLDFYAECNGYKLEWTLKDVPEELRRKAVLNIPRYTSSQVVFSPFRPMGKFTFKCFDAMRIDLVPSKNQTSAARSSGGAKAQITIVSSFTGRTFPSFDAYLAEGARSAFHFGWQYGPLADKAKLPWAPSDAPWEQNQPVIEELKKRSMPAETDRDVLVGMLVAKGLTDEEAKGLWDWIGSDTRLLLEAR